MCQSIAWLAFAVRRGDRRLAVANLAKVFPDSTAHQRRGLLTSSVRFLGVNFFHSLAAPRLLRFTEAEEGSTDADNQTVAGVIGDLTATGRGVLILSGHIGCWDLTGAWLSRELIHRGLGPLGVVTGTVHNPAVDRLLQDHRRALGVKVFPRELGAGPVVRFLQSGGVLATLQDQRTRVRNLDVPFFGYDAPTPVALAMLALKYKLPVLPVAGVWDPQRRQHRIRHLAPIWPDDYDEGDLHGYLACCNRALEKLILGNPEQWVWFHRRWHDSLPGEL